MDKYNWQRRNLSLAEYKERMKGKETKKTNDADNNAITENKMLEAAYKEASKIRRFEIELFWKRATFFWAFIVAIYTAYFQVLTKIYAYGDEPNIQYYHGKFPLLVLAALGLFFCFSWLLSSKGSKHWQENWEKHLDLLENKVTGPLHKIYEAGKSYSESKITIAAGWIVSACSYSLLIYEFVNMIKDRLNKKFTIQLLFSFLFAVTVAVCLFAYSQLMIGNNSNSGNFEFQIKEYEGLDYE